MTSEERRLLASLAADLASHQKHCGERWDILRRQIERMADHQQEMHDENASGLRRLEASVSDFHGRVKGGVGTVLGAATVGGAVVALLTKALPMVLK